MGFSLQEAQWLVKFFRNLPGQVAPSAEIDRANASAMQVQAPPETGMEMPMEMQGEMQDMYPANGYPEEYYDEYW